MLCAWYVFVTLGEYLSYCCSLADLKQFIGCFLLFLSLEKNLVYKDKNVGQQAIPLGTYCFCYTLYELLYCMQILNIVVMYNTLSTS